MNFEARHLYSLDHDINYRGEWFARKSMLLCLGICTSLQGFLCIMFNVHWLIVQSTVCICKIIFTFVSFYFLASKALLVVHFGFKLWSYMAQICWIVSVVHGISEKYVAYITPRSGAMDRDFDKLSLENENGFLWDTIISESNEGLGEDGLRKESTPEVGISGDAFNSWIDFFVQKNRWCLDKGYVGKKIPDEG